MSQVAETLANEVLTARGQEVAIVSTEEVSSLHFSHLQQN